MGTTLTERIIAALEEADGPLTDAQLAAALKVVHQAVNQTCRTLQQHGVLTRQKLVGSNIVNVLTGVPVPAKPQPAESSGQLLAEDEVKTAVRDHLQGQGYVVKVAWGHEPGIDIDAIRPGDHLLTEAKGEAASHPQQANYFVGALGELVQRFAEPGARYCLALPDSPQYRALAKKLPLLARTTLNLIVFFVSRHDGEYIVEVS
jgi:hypothetical protein